MLVSAACLRQRGERLNLMGLAGRDEFVTLELDLSVVRYERHGASIAI
jgi:hypothetical protein